MKILFLIEQGFKLNMNQHIQHLLTVSNYF